MTLVATALPIHTFAEEDMGNILTEREGKNQKVERNVNIPIQMRATQAKGLTNNSSEQEDQIKTPEQLGFDFTPITETTGKITKDIQPGRSDLVIPKQVSLDGKVYNVTEIGDGENNIQGSFYAINGGYKSLTLPEGIKKINTKAFFQVMVNETIENIYFPESLEVIGESAFENNNIQKIEIPSGVKKIGKGAFKYSNKLQKLTFKGDDIEDLGQSTFGSSYELNKVILPKRLTKIPQGMFVDCVKLMNIDIPTSVSAIGRNAFVKGATLNFNMTEKEFNKKTYAELVKKNYKVNLKEDNSSESDEKENVIEDPYLKKAINIYLNSKKIDGKDNRREDAPLNKEDLLNLGVGDFGGFYTGKLLTEEDAYKIRSLEGLQYAKNLKDLSLKTKATDLTPLKSLDKVTTLFIKGGEGEERSDLKNFDALKGMTNLKYLKIYNTSLDDITLFTQMPKLWKIHLCHNKISDLSPFERATYENISQIWLEGNEIADFSVFAGVSKDIKDAFKPAKSNQQKVNVKPDKLIFNNPLKTNYGNIQSISEQPGLLVKAGEKGELIQLLGLPSSGNTIVVNYPGKKDGPFSNKLIIDISNVREELEKLEEEKEDEKYLINFVVRGIQEEDGNKTTIERFHNDVDIKVFDESKNEIKNTSEDKLSYIWKLPKGDYTYKVEKEQYETKTGSFTVTGEKNQKVVISLKYENEKNPYPYLKNLKIVSRIDGTVLGTGEIKGQLISVVVSNPDHRKLLYEGKAMLKGEPIHATKIFMKTEASPFSNKVTETSTTANSFINESGVNYPPFAKDSITYLGLTGENGKSSHYVLVIKENKDQKAVLFMAPSYTDGDLGSLKVESKSGEEYYEVYRFVQLVDSGKPAVEPIKYIKDKYDKNAYMKHSGGTFEGWFYDYDWKEEHDFSTKIYDNMELKAKFTNSGSINDFSKPFTVRMNSLLNLAAVTEVSYKKDNKWIVLKGEDGFSKMPKIMAGEELEFKIQPNEGYKLAFVTADYAGNEMPIRQTEAGHFIYKPVSTQDNDLFNGYNEVIYGLIPEKQTSRQSFDINKQHHINLQEKGVRLSVDNSIMNYRHNTLGQAGDTIKLELEYYKFENLEIKTASGNIIQPKKISGPEESRFLRGNFVETFEFTMPDEDVTISGKGTETGKFTEAIAQFNFKDKEGNPIPPDQIEKLSVYTYPYGTVETKDTSKPLKLWTNTNIKAYSYLAYVKNKGIFSGEFEWNGSSKEITLTLDVNKDTGKTEKDVQNLMDIAKGLLEDKNYPKESLEKLEKAIGEAKDLSQKQNFEKAHEVLSKAIDEVLEGNQPDVPDQPKEKDFDQAKASLKKAVDKADNLKKEGYTKATWAVFANALKNAKSELQLAKKAEDLEKAEKALKAAQDELEPVEEPEDKDLKDAKDKLDTAIKEAEKLKKEDYTKETWEDFENALKNAKSEAKFDKATVKSLENAKKDLKDAQDKLKKVDAVAEEAEKINQDHKDLVKNAKFTDMLDVSGHWAETYIKYVMDRGYLVGTSKHYFSPNRDTTRAEFVTVLARLAGVKEENYKKNQFTDVPKGVYYEAAVNWAEDKGIVLGVGDKKFAPNQTMTREEMATILDRYIEKTSKVYSGGQEQSFKDQGNIASWAKDSVKRMTKAGILEGTDQGKFEPKANFSRSELATVIYRLDK